MHDLDGLNAQFSGMNVLVVSVTPDSVDQLRGWMGAGGPQYGKVLSDPGLVAFNLYHPVGNGGSMMTHTFLLINKAGIGDLETGLRTRQHVCPEHGHLGRGDEGTRDVIA